VLEPPSAARTSTASRATSPGRPLTVAAATHQSLIDNERYAAQSSRAIRNVVKEVQTAGG
jgi:hypothetical protein